MEKNNTDIINLYHLAPQDSPDITLVNDFKFQDFANNILKLQVKNINYIPIRKISEYMKITPNDYLLVSDIFTKKIGARHDIAYYTNVLKYFDFNKRIVFLYENVSHRKHKWKIDFVLNNFKLIFQNQFDLVKNHSNVFWIPTCHLFINNDLKVNTEKKYMAGIGPISYVEQIVTHKILTRTLLVQRLCQQISEIKVYGHPNWFIVVPSEKYGGYIPNENNNAVLKERMNNKIIHLSNHKFVFAIENLFIDGYVTEKLSEALFTSSVVIYYGPPNIHLMYPELFNMCVINGHLHKINGINNIIVNMSQEEYNRRVAKMNLLKNEINFNNSSESVKDYIASKINEFINGTKNDTTNSIYSIKYINDMVKSRGF